MRGIVATGCAAMLLVACGETFSHPGEERPALPVTTTIAHFTETHTGTTCTVTGDIVVAGTVTTSDEEGNFYRSLCIEHEGAGVEIMAGLDRLHRDYPVGSRVILRLKGLSTGRSRGVVQIGRAPLPGSGYATDYIGSKPALDLHLFRDGEALNPLQPALLTVAQLTPERCGSLVRIEGLRYAPEELTPATWAGEKLFRDAAGGEIRTYVRPYARFAAQEVPAGPGSITGILQRDDNGNYLLKPRHEEDLLH